MRKTQWLTLSIVLGIWGGTLLLPAADVGAKAEFQGMISPLRQAHPEKEVQNRQKAQETLSLGSLPIHFVENFGQVEGSVRFHDQGRTIFFERDSIQFRLPGQPAPVVLTPVGMSKAVELAAAEPLAGQVSYFTGSKAQPGYSGLSTYRAVVYRNAYPGVDIKFYGTTQRLEYDIIAQPGADLSTVRFQYSGVERMERSESGDLLVHLPYGQVMVQRSPLSYQWVEGNRVEVQSRFQIDPSDAVPSRSDTRPQYAALAKPSFTYGFEVDSYDTTQPLIIDPVLAFSTYLGSLGTSWAWDIAVDREGSIYITGETEWDDMFVLKLHPTGKKLDLVYAAYLGGNKSDGPGGIALDQAGNAYLTGYTSSEDFPVKNALYPKLFGDSDIFVSKLNPSGTGLVYSTYIGGTKYDYGGEIAVDETGKVYVTGYTQSTDFPLESAYDDTLGGTSDAVVLKLSATGQALLYSTYLGGSNSESGEGIVVDKSGNAYVTGYTYSSDFPTRNAYDSTLDGTNTSDAFVTKFNASGNKLLYSTYLGGNDYEFAEDIDVDRSGNAYLTGGTRSSNFPTKNAYDNSLGGTRDSFVTKLAANGQALLYSTYLGGSKGEYSYGVIVNGKGEAHVVGYTESVNFPTKKALYKERIGKDDAFVTKFNASGALSYSTYLGGSDYDYAYSIAVYNSQNIYVTGETVSEDFPTKQAIEEELWWSDHYDAFLTVIKPDKSGS